MSSQSRQGDVVLVHKEGPRSTWKLAVIKKLIRGGDGLVRAAHIRTSTGYTHRPVTKLYPLEITTTTGPRIASHDGSEQQPTAVVSTRPRRAATTEAMRRISEWTRRIRPHPRRMSNRLELNLELSRFCYCCNSVCHVVVAMKCMRAQLTWQKLVIGSPYWNTVVIFVEFSFLVSSVLFALPAFGLTLLSQLYTHMTEGHPGVNLIPG